MESSRTCTPSASASSATSPSARPARRRRICWPAFPKEYVDHHTCHAASAYYPSGFETAEVVTVDGVGDTYSVRFFRGEKGKLQPRKAFFHTACPFGHNYEFVTTMLGFHPHRHAGKVTGLAGHGKHDERLMQAMDRWLHEIWSVGKGRPYFFMLHSQHGSTQGDQAFTAAVEGAAPGPQDALRRLVGRRHRVHDPDHSGARRHRHDPARDPPHRGTADRAGRRRLRQRAPEQAGQGDGLRRHLRAAGHGRRGAGLRRPAAGAGRRPRASALPALARVPGPRLRRGRARAGHPRRGADPPPLRSRGAGDRGPARRRPRGGALHRPNGVRAARTGESQHPLPQPATRR